MRRGSSKKKKSALEEFSDSDLSDSDLHMGPDPDDPDYRAIRITIFGGHCAWRDTKKKLKSDPYLVVEYQGQTKETTLLHNTTHPKWEETFEFPIYNINALGQLTIQMWDQNDKETKKGQIFMGEIRIAIPEFQDVSFEFAHPRQYSLGIRSRPDKKDNVKGDLTLKLGMIIPKAKQDFGGRNGKKQSTEQIIRESEYIVDDSLASVQRSLKMAENARSVGAETLDKLNAQGQQIQRVQDHLDDIDDSQNRADAHLRAINSIGGAFGNNFRRKPSRRNGLKQGDRLAAKRKKQRDKARKGEEDSDEEEDDLGEEFRESRSDRRARYTDEVGSSKSGGGRVNDMYKADFTMLSEDHQDKIKQTDRALDQIGNVIDDLKIIALEMGDEIDEHNARLEVMGKSVDRANSRMKHHNAKINRKVA